MTPVVTKKVALIVAHPDDETLWAGGTILLNPAWQCFIVCLCRGKDKQRALRFNETLKRLNLEGIMGDLDDGPEQKPLQEDVLDCMILDLLPPIQFDLIITHNPTGEYTRHLRHEETSKAVIELWFAGKITTAELWTFAYEDGGKTYYPQAVKNTPIYRELDAETWRAKYQLITQTYGFKKSSWEAKTTPRAESFWRFFNPDEAVKWLNHGGTRT